MHAISQQLTFLGFGSHHSVVLNEKDKQQQQQFYNHYTGQPALAGVATPAPQLKLQDFVGAV